MLPDNHTLITAVWTMLHVLPLVLVAILWAFFGAFWGIAALLLYIVGIIPYGFFISIPTMLRLFHKPASLHRR